MNADRVSHARIALPLFLLLTAIAAVLFSGCVEPQPLMEQERLADLNYLLDLFIENHPFISLKDRVEGYNWAAHHDEFRALVADCANDREFAVTMSRIIGLLNNMHTNVVGKSHLSLWLPENVTRNELTEPWFRVMEQVELVKAQYWYGLVEEQGFGNPLATAYLAGEYIVTLSTRDTTGVVVPVGARVIDVNGVGVHEYVDSRRGLDWQPYDPIRGRTYDRVLRLPTGDCAVTLSMTDGSITRATFKVRTSKSVQTPFRPERFTGPYTLSTRSLSGFVIDDTAAYLAISQMDVRTGSAFEEEVASMRRFLTYAAQLPAIIIDIRGNGGGRDTLWQTLISMLISEPIQVDVTVAVRDGDYVSPFYSSMVGRGFVPLSERDWSDGSPIETPMGGFRVPLSAPYPISPDEDSIRYEGKVFLLVDDRVCSSAENFAAYAKASGFATLVGGVTGGDGFGFELCAAVLPNSGMVVSFPLAMGFNPDGTVNEETHTSPDYLVEWSPDDVAKWTQYRGRAYDVVFQECLRLAKAP